MGFSSYTSLKSKFAASVAIVATVFSALAVAVPAHATASVYTPNAGSNWSSLNSYGNHYTLTPDTAGVLTGTMALANDGMPQNTNFTLNIPSSADSYFGDGVAHMYEATIEVRNSANVVQAFSINLNNFSTGSVRTYAYSSYINGSAGWGNYFTIDPSATNIQISLNGYSAMNSLESLPAGNYTVKLSIKRDGVQMTGARYSSTAADNTASFQNISPGISSISLDGNQTSAYAYVYTCLDTANITVGDTLTMHPLLDGADYLFGSSYNWKYYVSGIANYGYNQSFTATSALLTGLDSVNSYIMVDSSGSTGTHTVGLSVYDATANREVSAACTVPTPSTAPTVTSNPLTTVDVALGVQGSSGVYPYLTVEALDPSNTVVASTVTSGSTTPTTVQFSASKFTSGTSYTVRYKKTANFYNGGPASAWSPTASFTFTGAVAPTMTQSNGQAIATATGLASNSYVAQAYLASSPSTPVAAASMNASGVTGTYTATFSSGLTYGTPYVFSYCQGYTNYVNGVATAVCNSGLSAQSASISIVAPSYGYAVPTVSGAGTVGAAQTGLTATTYNSGTFSRGSDGSNGSFVGQVGSGQITIKHLTPAGMDSNFGTNGTITVPATGVMNIYSLTWTGNRDKWAMTWADSSMNVTAVVGNYSGTVLSSYTMSSSSAAGAAICNQSGGFTGITSGNIYPPMVSNPMGDTYLMYSCQVPFTYSDSTSGSVMAYILTKVTANNTATVVAKFNAVSNAENVVNGLTGSSSPTYSVNPTATGTAAAVVFAFAYGAKTSATGMVSQFNRKLVVLKADGTVTSVNGGTVPTLGGMSSETVLMSSVNNGSTLEGIVTNTGSYSYRRYDVATAAVTDVALTPDALSGFTTSQYALPTNTVQSTATGNIWVLRTYTSGTTTKIAAAQLNVGTAAFTSYEAVTFAATSSNPTYNWTLNSLDASGNVVSLYASSMTAFNSVYWRSTAASSGPSNVATASFTLNGSAATDGGSYNVSNSATSATVAVTPTESHATYTVSGNTSLSVGNNTVTIVVTAQDGTTTHTYTFTVVRAAVVLPTYVLSFDKNNSSATGTTASVSATSGWAAATNGYSLTNYSFTGWNTLANGNGTAYAAGASITLTADTTLYAQWLRDPYVLTFNGNTGASGTMANATSRTSWTLPSTVGFTKANNFFSGWNTAANGSGTSYAVGASVTASADTTLYAQWTAIPSDGVLCPAGTYSASHGGYSSVTNSWTCTDAPAGSYVSTIGALAASLCAAGYFSANSASTACIPASVGHFVALAGAAAEVACAANTHAYNTGAIACDPDRVLSSNKKASFLVAGKPAANGSVVEITGVPSSIGVLVNLADNRANATVSVPATPVLGNNLVTVFVYAEDDSVQESNITVHISAPVVTPPVVVPPTPVLSSDATAAIKANGASVADGGVINLAAGTTSVAVTVTPTESHATATVAGAAALVTGNNTVTVTVTAQDGSKKTYSFTAAVAAPLSADATATITVAGITVNDGDHVSLPFGTSQVAVAVTPTEGHATYSVAGATGLATGTSVLTVTVTAQNGATKAYSYQLVVAADTTPVNVSGSSVSVLDRVKGALGAGRTAMVTFSAKGAAAHNSVVSQIRTFKAAARAAGISGRISFNITDAGNAATGLVRVGY